MKPLEAKALRRELRVLKKRSRRISWQHQLLVDTADFKTVNRWAAKCRRQWKLREPEREGIMSREKNTPKPICIQWRVKSQASFLTTSDLAWTEFAAIRVLSARHLESTTTSAEMIVRAMHGLKLEVEMDFRIKP